jgi:hypothetical protein
MSERGRCVGCGAAHPTLPVGWGVVRLTVTLAGEQMVVAGALVCSPLCVARAIRQVADAAAQAEVELRVNKPGGAS